MFDNALKYTPAQGQVTVLLTEKDGFAWVTVADNGRGISAENLPHIGKRFIALIKHAIAKQPVPVWDWHLFSPFSICTVERLQSAAMVSAKAPG